MPLITPPKVASALGTTSKCPLPSRHALHIPPRAISNPSTSAWDKEASVITRITPTLSSKEIVERLRYAVPEHARSNYLSFFSSELGGITTDPAFMLIHADDHMVHRGHAVFDTSTIVKGTCYLLHQHLTRFFDSAEMAGIPLPFSKDRIRKIILDTAAVAGVEDGELRFWLSVGRGGFGLTTRECPRASLYVQCTRRIPRSPDFTQTWTARTTSVPAKPGIFARIKSNNYLPNALSLLEAEQSGFDQGIFVDHDGFVSEGPNMNLLVYTADQRLLTPTPENCLAGCTVRRLMELVQYMLDHPTPYNREHHAWFYEHVKGASFVPRMRPDEVKASAKELFLVGSSILVRPVSKWDDTLIGASRAAETSQPLFETLWRMLDKDMEPEPFRSDIHVPIPFGAATGSQRGDAYFGTGVGQ